MLVVVVDVYGVVDDDGGGVIGCGDGDDFFGFKFDFVGFGGEMVVAVVVVV